MRAIVLEAFGGPERLTVGTLPVPAPERGEVLVRVHAAGVNPVDAQNREDGTWAGLQLPAVLGSDFSGVIEQLGHGVTAWEIGQEVFGMSPFRNSRLGTYAEYHVAAAAAIAAKPESLDHVEAAAVPLAACTAYAVVNERLAVRTGEWLPIHGAAGGVGCYAVQLARTSGARVIAVASSRHHELLHALGAEGCINYESEDVIAAAERRAGGRVDAVADFVGGDTLSRSLPGTRAARVAPTRQPRSAAAEARRSAVAGTREGVQSGLGTALRVGADVCPPRARPFGAGRFFARAPVVSASVALRKTSSCTGLKPRLNWMSEPGSVCACD